MAGLYFHIPFCKRICAYCDFYKSVGLGRMEELAAAMHRELEAQREYLGGEAVRTRYFGGGTPSLCPPGTIAGLLDHAGELFDCSAAEETTLEANPDDLTPIPVSRNPSGVHSAPQNTPCKQAAGNSPDRSARRICGRSTIRFWYLPLFFISL